MATKKGICKNVFNCTKADANEIQEIDEFQDFKCAECGAMLEDVDGGKGPTTPPPPIRKKLTAVIAAAVVAAGVGVGGYFAMSGGGSDISVTVSEAEKTVEKGETFTLTETVNSDGDVQVVWTSTDENVAKVEGGKVTAVAAGTAEIIVTARADEKTAADTCVVTVNAEAITSVAMSESAKSLKVGESFTLTPTVNAEGDVQVEWTSTDEKVAKVEDGKVTAIAAGTAEIVATAKVGEETVSAGCVVTVEKKGTSTGTGVTSGTVHLSYGKYTGGLKNGLPDGSGVLVYTKAQKVVSTKDIVAQPGERIEGVFENGKATFVTLYKKDGNAIKIKR